MTRLALLTTCVVDAGGDRNRVGVVVHGDATAAQGWVVLKVTTTAGEGSLQPP